MNNKFILIIVGILVLALAGIVVVNSASAEASYCCERLKSNGAWCQNAPQEQCDVNYRDAPTSCESTSYCKLGTCTDSEDGICTGNTPQKVCEDNKGVWYDKKPEDIPQCGLGCCLIGDQAAFVTQTRCKRLSSLYGLETNFRTDISNEIQCIATTVSEAKGACVFEREFERTCTFTTRKECSKISGNASFHEGYLCSDESLGTNCGKSKKTTCVDGKDGVYFTDTCGNIANIYDASKADDPAYWSKLKDESESCGYGGSNANSANCGNCDYYSGSTCKNYDRSEDKTKPVYGNNICRDLGCKFEGKVYEHGETWCDNSDGVKNNLPGSRHFRMVCYNGEVSVEPCADFRQEICIQDEINGFLTSGCRVNKWQDCVSQTEKKDCENKDKRDCQWLNGKCTPEFAPGFNFWEAGDAESICSQANTQCVVGYEKKLGSGEKCKENCECLLPSWTKKNEEIGRSLGDCGNNTNWLGQRGF